MSYGTVRRWVLATAVVGLIGASPGIAAGAPSADQQVKFADQSTPITRLTAAIHMTKDNRASARAFTGPTVMLANPSNPRIVVAATAELRTRVCYLLRSNDAGLSWHILPALPARPTYPYCTTADNAGSTQAAIAWGRDNTLYYALGAYGAGEGDKAAHTSIVLARSTDLGNSWTTTLVDNNRGKTGVAPTDSGVTGLAVDTSGPRDAVYVGFMQSYPDAPKDSHLQDGKVIVAVSTDGGTTFDHSADINTFSHVTQTIEGVTVPLQMMTYFGGPFLLAHNGVIEAISGPQTPFDAPKLPGTSFHAMPELVARSTDQGRTWAVSTLGPPIFTGTGSQTGLGWSPLGGPKGTFTATYAATPESATSSGSANVVFQRSTDLGETWSDPVVLNDDDPTQQFTHFYPQLGVAPNGRVDIVWETNRDQHDYHFQTMYTYSTDGGATWAHNVQVSDRPINFGLGVSFNSDIRQPPGVASANQYAAFGWADTRLGNDTTQTQDDFAVVAQFAPLPAKGSTVLPVVAAVFGGLALAGIILVLALLIRRRRQVPEPAVVG
ncbi:MAG: hypothetical protein QOJ52_4327 [Acidimicrobiaceae bacterium]|jgi:hypothetical protein|nr:hypothetical protein [Acidimicrobiaceae bacterium]